MTQSTMHPIDRLIRRLQTEPGSRKLDVKIARTLHGAAVRYCFSTRQYLLDSKSHGTLPVAHYTATRQQVERACSLLRKRKAELTAPAVMRMAA